MSSFSIDPPELDLHVKGSLPSGASPISTYQSPPQLHHPPLQPTNPLDHAPSSPSQIYLNLLILEASLRSQYLHHLGRRRKFTFFLIVLCLWTAFFFYRFFVLGGSPYYYVSLFEKLGLGGGVVTGVLYYATGLYHSTIVEPRQFVSITNRGLRGFNVKLVKIPLSYREWIHWWWGWYTFRAPPPPQSTAVSRRPSSNTRRPIPPVPSHSHTPSLSSMAVQRPSVQSDEDRNEDEVEEYLQGGLHLKLVILPKGFSPDFREGWELYRTEYWDKENEARQSRREELNVRRHMKLLSAAPSAPGVAAAEKHVRSSRAGSVSSHRGRRTPTPDPDHRAVSSGRVRRGSTASLKRRSITGVPPRAGTPGEISDSGSTTSALGGERDRARRSESVRTDKSSSSTGSAREQQTQKPSGRSQGKKRTTQGNESPVDEEDSGDRH
ncbi:Spo7-like protein-domain-containing protein [Trichophaea hybrida]|nr:Spo7-like protein-domain-containing protein [Trichophaea hybrida]